MFIYFFVTLRYTSMPATVYPLNKANLHSDYFMKEGGVGADALDCLAFLLPVFHR